MTQPRALDPSRIVQTGMRRVLLARLRKRVPAAVKHDKDHADLVPIGGCQELFDALYKRLGVALQGAGAGTPGRC